MAKEAAAARYNLIVPCWMKGIFLMLIPEARSMEYATNKPSLSSMERSFRVGSEMPNPWR